MTKPAQDYASASFEKVAEVYDQIDFFKQSAKHLVQLTATENPEPKSILDLACGTGNTTLEFAKWFVSTQIDGIDISAGMLAKAKQNAQAEGLNNVNFIETDITQNLQVILNRKYSIICCAYAMFFLPDADKLLQQLKGLLKPDGLIIFSSFQQQAFKPVNDMILELLRQYGSETALEYQINDWKNLRKKSDIERLCQLAEMESHKITGLEIRYPMSIDDWWKLLNNTGFKGMLLELSEANFKAVKASFYKQMARISDSDGQVELNADSYFTVIFR
jgi:ubiquinone/menaquinone biosynthesis C-methylase UbiE